jgi:hypothetical protein
MIKENSTSRAWGKDTVKPRPSETDRNLLQIAGRLLRLEISQTSELPDQLRERAAEKDNIAHPIVSLIVTQHG